MRSFSATRIRSELDRCQTLARKNNIPFNDKAACEIKSLVKSDPSFSNPEVNLLRDGRLCLSGNTSKGRYYNFFGDKP